MRLRKLFYLFFISLIFASCKENIQEGYSRYDYPNILDIHYTPNEEGRCGGWFTDAGCWWGFTPPQKGNWVNGLCGPFHLDNRVWFSQALVQAAFAEGEVFTPDSLSYFPGELYLSASSANGQIEQRLIFMDKSHALLSIDGKQSKNEKLSLVLSGNVQWAKKLYSKSPLAMELCETSVIVRDTTGEGFVVTFPKGAEVSLTTPDSTSAGYRASYGGAAALEGASKSESGQELKCNVLITFITATDKTDEIVSGAAEKLGNSKVLREENLARWNGYFKSVIRKDMPMEYNRIAAKAVTTLLANWKSARGDLFHDGVVPSHAVGYFMGFWGWDSWKHAVALSKFAPELAKDQVRAMFDYQDEDGMIIDCIYSNKADNNARDSKPPLAGWAVSEIFKNTGDSSFVKEMYPRLAKYFGWWFKYRDHNKNGICEFGSCDGTLEAAAWESGMDNAIRYDSTVMVYNGKTDAAGKVADDGKGSWSMNQESVDLNAFLAYEHRLLGELAVIANGGAGSNYTGVTAGDVVWKAGDVPAIGKPYPLNIADYFFNKEQGFFFDKRFDSTFVFEEGTEACIPLWAGLATQEQADAAAQIFTNPNKFATYIPFPTIAADNPKFMPAGYWRGPIWLDQVYFGINGLRKYGYKEQADAFTKQVFDRLYGLKEGAPIHENYNTHNGSLLKAPHFSWSSAHLLMLYMEMSLSQ